MKFHPNFFPSSPGIYLMKDKNGAILYIGKAKDLKKRVASYFKKESKERYQIRFLMERVGSIDFVKTGGEKEAILLEYKLIQKHKPRYNIQLKDSKTFIRIKLSSHPYPAIYVTRKIKKDGATYFGPYTSAKTGREMADQAVKFFKIRTCSDSEFRNRSRPCIQYGMSRCTAPCVGYISRPDYSEQVRDAKMFLKGKNKGLLVRLKEEMNLASNAMKYEDAARKRDLISGIKKMLGKQKILKADEGVRPEESEDIYNVIGDRLKSALHLKDVPHVIECADISNVHGKFASGAVVCFVAGAPFKKRYRLFNITREGTPNDYAMMHEVLERRFRHAEWGVPDLLLVDGGRGQLAVASKVIKDLNILNMAVAAIAKIEGSHRKGSDRARVFLPNRVNPILAPLYLMKIRDEAHRFAIAHYRRRHLTHSTS